MKFKVLNRLMIALILAIFALGILFDFYFFWLFLGVLLGYLIFLLVVSSNIQLNFFVNAHNNNPYVKNGEIAITFDDGPVENTSKILDILAKHEIKASFFCIGKHAERNPELLKRIISEGHIIGNHTYSHTRKMGFLSSKKIQKEIEKCDLVINEITGLKLNFFRPPFGIINPKTKRALRITGHRVIGWKVRSYDAVLNSEKYILKRIKRDLRPGDVILFHDSNPQTAVILEQLLLFLRTKNFSTVRVDTLFKIDAYS